MIDTERLDPPVRGGGVLEFDDPELARIVVHAVQAAAQGLSRSEAADLSGRLDALTRFSSVIVTQMAASMIERFVSGWRDSRSRPSGEPRSAHSTEADPPVPAPGPAAKPERITFDEIVQRAVSSRSGTATSPSRTPSSSPGGAPTIETIKGGEMTLLRYLDPQRISRWHTPSGRDEELLTSDQLAARVGLKTRQSVHNWLRQGRVIGWRGAKRQYLFPADQIDERGRPLTGLEPILDHFGDGYAAWVWLTTPLSALDGQKPLQLLRSGERDRVMAAVQGDLQGDFG